MTKNARIAAVALAMTMTGTLMMSAQTPAPADRQHPATATDTLKLTGCLKLEKDVPGLKPSVAEQVGISDDYILTNAMLSKDSSVAGIGVSPMYEIKGITKAELKKHLNHQVEIEGMIGAPGVEGNAPDFTATSLKMLAATCPAQ
jgi:hypothetical protein